MKIIRPFLFLSFLLGTFLSLQATVVTLNPQSGELQGSNTFTIQVEDVGQQIFNPLNITNNPFMGWYDAPIGGKQVYNSAGTPCSGDYFKYVSSSKKYVWKSEAETLTLYAHWQITKLSFDTRGGDKSDITETSVLAYSANDSKKTSVGTAGQRPGFTFLGWFSAPQGGDMAYDAAGKAVEGTFWKTDNSSWKWKGGDYQFTLYAQWRADVTANEDPDHLGDFYSTFYDEAMAYIIPRGVTAYTLGLNGNVLNLNAIEGDVIPKGTGVILKATASSIPLQPVDYDTAPISGNGLTGIAGDAEQSQAQGYDYYMLSYGQNQLGFYRMSAGQKLAPHKAFIRLDAASGSAKASFYGFAEDASALQVLNLDELPTSSSIYNLSGQKSGLSDPGIHIVNGRKTLHHFK